MSNGPHDDAATRPGDSASGPLQRRLLSGVQPLDAHAHDVHHQHDAPDPALERAEAAAVSYATLGMLDGTVIARLPCGEELGSAGIGRGSLSDIRIHDPWIHREHASIAWDAVRRAHVIEHAGGANGTFVNLQRISTPTRLTDGARVRVGKTELIYRIIR